MIYRFGNFELDTATRELRDQGQVVETEPKAFELLLYLLQNADRAVSKDELQTELWPRTIVTETALTRAVMKARRAVGDDANAQSVIRTVHGHGYRFVAPLGEQPIVTTSEPESSPRRPYLRYAVIAIIFIAAFVSVLRNLGPMATNNAQGPAAVAVLPITNMTEDPALSWVELGLMGLMSRMLEDGGVEIVPERAVMSTLGEQPLPRPVTDEFVERIYVTASANRVLDVSLEHTNGLYRMSATLAQRGGERVRRVIVGETPTSVAADMTRVITGLLDTNNALAERRLRRVSSDPFVNEAYARALDLELQGNLEEARTLFSLAAEQEPDLFWLRYEIALCTRDLREWNDAEAQFDALLKEAQSASDGGAQVATLNSMAVMFINRQRYAEAAEILEQASSVSDPGALPDDLAAVYVNQALVASHQNDRDAARGYYELALAAFEAAEQNPSPGFLNNFAGLLMSEGQLDEARAYSERSVEGFQLRGQRRYEASALNRLGKILRRQGDIDGALARHEQALQIQRDLENPIGEVIVMMAMTNVWRETGDLTRARLNAMEVRDRAMTLDNDAVRADAHMFLAQVEEDLNNIEVARNEYVAARNIFVTHGTPPGLRYADESIARTTFLLGDHDQAMTLANDLLESAGDDVRAIARTERLIAQIELAQGNGKDAVSRLLAVIDTATERDDQATMNGATPELANAYLEIGMVEEAAALVRSLAEPDPPDPDHERLRARLAHARGENERAAEIMSALRTRAGEAWNADDQEKLEQYSAELD